MLTNFGVITNEQQERIVLPLPMSAVYNKQQFISHFISLHHQSTQPTLINQLLTNAIPNTFSEFWILYDERNRPIACAAANTVISDTSVGYVGLFEAKTEQAGTAVLKAATQWLKHGGLQQFEPVRQILGPVNMTTWLQYRLRVDNDIQSSMSYEPRHPAFYQGCFAKAGFVKAMDYYSTFFDIDQFLTGYEDYSQNVSPEEAGISMQYWNLLDFPASLNPERHPELSPQDNVSRRVYDLSMEMFHGKEFFDDDFSPENHRKIVLNDMISRPEVDNASLTDLSSFVVDSATGQDVGYLACWVEDHDTLVMKTVGFVSRVRKTKVFAIAVRETARRAKEHWGCTRVACALMNGNTVGINERVCGESIRHVYRLYMHQPSTTTVSTEQHVQDDAPERYAVTLQRQPASNTTSVLQTTNGLPENPQKRDTDTRVQTFLDKRRLQYLGQRSRHRVMVRL
ncbi:hypothetical protein BGZ79_004844 [Entomortierella chlamydospora]|nr:hypothetical protein BGZ79_004844 [Entomortierella chlamydospora]